MQSDEEAAKPPQPEAEAEDDEELLQTPHDRLFHHVFSNPVHAAGELRSLLPAGISQRIDWATLEALPTRVIDKKLAEFRSDILFRAELEGHEVLLYLLLEHQNSADPLMPFRMLVYVVKIWEHYLREHPDARRLPAIVPMVLHHSERGWTAPTNLRALLDLDDEPFVTLSAYLPTFELLLDDISTRRDDELLGRAMSDLARLTLLCLKQLPRSENPIADLRRWFDLCAAVVSAPDGIAAFYALARYILATTETQPNELLAFARELGPKTEEAFMTGEQMLIARGVEKGKAEGRAEGKAEVLLKLAGAKFGSVPEALVARIQTASLDELDRWVERILDAKSLDDVFAD
jgi:predicted transposase/invertase (TIGR01784 family)